VIVPWIGFRFSHIAFHLDFPEGDAVFRIRVQQTEREMELMHPIAIIVDQPSSSPSCQVLNDALLMPFLRKVIYAPWPYRVVNKAQRNGHKRENLRLRGPFIYEKRTSVSCAGDMILF
jgi:hypothetical protein